MNSSTADPTRPTRKISLAGYIERVFKFDVPPHAREWCEKIEALIDGVLPSGKRKLLLVSPPGHMKSTVVSQALPCWYLGHNPAHSLLFFTSSDILAHQFNGTVEEILESNPSHARLFANPNCRPNKKRGWSNDGLYLAGTRVGAKDPAYRAVGYSTHILGARAHGIILDDPLTEEESKSEREMEQAKPYHENTIKSRLDPLIGWEICITNRWTEDDLAGFLKKERADEWEVVEMPAIEVGEDTGEERALWPERFPLPFLQTLRAADPVGFECLYQLDPTSVGGNMFVNGSIAPLPEGFRRDKLAIVQFWDLAFSERQTADYTVGLTAGFSTPEAGHRDTYLLDVYRKKLSPAGVVEAMVEQIQQHHPDFVAVEEGLFDRAPVVRAIVRLVQEQTGRLIQVVPIRGRDKILRAQLPRERAEMGHVYADRAAEWWPIFIAEVVGFPLKAHDDQVDAWSGAEQIAAEKLGTPRLARGEYAIGGGSPKPASWDWGKDQGIYIPVGGIAPAAHDIHRVIRQLREARQESA